METLNKKDDQVIENEGTLNAKIQRRSFLRYAGAGAAGLGVLSACRKYSTDVAPVPPAPVVPGPAGPIDLGSGDVGILNFAYALEQLEAAFYIQVIATPYSGMSGTELSYLTDIRDHEVLHRDFFKAAIGSAAIQGLTPDFSSINFADRSSVLNAAKAFEDTGVSAYNGAGQYITNSANGIVYLGLAGKIVSVEARHAALIRDLINPGSFADNTVLNSDALDVIQNATQVLAIANSFLVTKVSGANLPNK